MNYRHAFHAGNFGDCMKHALLLALLDAMARKPAPFLVVDTHAGAGRYDLTSGPAERTGEWRAGIGRLLDGLEPPALAPYLSAVRALGLYPGSPALIRARLRPNDRLVACELHPDAHAALRRLFADDRPVAVHLRDGYEAVRAFLPPPERRALVLIDPPFEDGADFSRMAAAIATARDRFKPVVVAAWYPVKGRAPIRAFHDALRQSGKRDLIAAELLLREPTDAARLNGCGLLVATPPWRFQDDAQPILDALLSALGDGGPGAAATVTRLTDE